MALLFGVCVTAHVTSFAQSTDPEDNILKLHQLGIDSIRLDYTEKSIANDSVIKSGVSDRYSIVMFKNNPVELVHKKYNYNYAFKRLVSIRTYKYDLLGRKIELLEKYDHGETDETKYYYNRNDKVSKTVYEWDGGKEITIFTYNSDGKLVTETMNSEDDWYIDSMIYENNKPVRRIHVMEVDSSKDGIYLVTEREVKYIYQADSLLKRVINYYYSDNITEETITHNTDGRYTVVSRTVDKYGRLDSQDEFTYDKNNLLIKRSYLDNFLKPLHSFSYVYNENQLLVSLYSISGNRTTTFTWHYFY